MLHAAFLRSPVAHARVVGIDTDGASQAPGVVAVFTGTDVEPHLTPGPYHTAILVPPGPPLHSCLATDKVRLVGDPIAMVVAESRYAAEDAVELIDVDYEMLPPIVQPSQALDPGSPNIFDSMGSNILVSGQVSTYGREPLEIRRMNVVKAEDQPVSMITGRTLRGITVDASLDRMEEQIDLKEFRAVQAAARADGRYLGIGVASYIEAAPGPRGDDKPLGSEPMQMYVDATGTVVVVTGQMPHGQSHETTLAQVAADEMGVPFDQVRVVYGDSDIVPSAHTGASRSAAMAGGAALHSARALKRKVLEAAADLFEASAEDLRLKRGWISVTGVPARTISLAEVAAARQGDAAPAGGLPTSLSVELDYDGGTGGWSGGTHCAVVDVDIGTGLVRVVRYLVVHDCGVLINPAVVNGQIRGGVAQGIGAVLLERSAYDPEGNCLTATLMDYLLPTTVDVPRIEVTHLETIPLDPDVNFRGVGEGGMIVSPVTVCNAIEDALAPLGGFVYEQHLPPTRILELAGVLPNRS
jgi:carbon-monoxide dehydrogenase large subunit